jgi:hypothetical protein
MPPSQQFFIYIYYTSRYMFRSFDHLRAEIHNMGIISLTTDPLLLEE